MNLSVIQRILIRQGLLVDKLKEAAQIPKLAAYHSVLVEKEVFYCLIRPNVFHFGFPSPRSEALFCQSEGNALCIIALK